MNNTETNSSTNPTAESIDKQADSSKEPNHNPRLSSSERVDMALRHFNLLYGAVTERKYGYLWASKDDEKITYPFAVNEPNERKAMAEKAIELSDMGYDVYYGINLMDTAPDKYHRANKETVTLQTAIGTDIDVEGGTHINDDNKKYPPTFDVAKSFLPFDSSILIDSGYGLHGLNLYATPLAITADLREQVNARNKNFINVIRSRAGEYSKAVDGVGDLARVLRVPGTYNYKCGRENAPLCHIVEVNNVRFTPDDLDARLAAFKTPAKKSTKSKVIPINPTDKPKPSEQERALAMLAVIPVAEQTYEDWVSVGMILKTNGNTCADWEQWSRADDRFKEGECDKKWQTFDACGGLTIATLHNFARGLYGYSEKDFQRDWYASHNPNPRIIHRPPDAQELSARLAELKKQPQSKKRDAEIIAVIRDMCTWNYKKNELGQIFKSTIKNTYRNAELIFTHDPNLVGLFGFDNFQGKIVFLKKAPWHIDFKTAQIWRDSDDAELRNYLRRNYAEFKERQLIEDYVITHARKNSFHPVKKFYETLPTWDDIERAETIFAKFLGAEDTPYTREVTLKWLLGAMARVYHPGCDFQWAPVIVGAQRIGKSRLAKMLGGGEGVNPSYIWHVALKDSVDDSHAIDAIQIGGIVEIEEFSAARKADINALKSFVSASADTCRLAYERHATTIPRHCVLIVTCNDQQFLRDPTGNARFWVIKCTNQKFRRVDGMTPDYIRQVWAEVRYRYMELFKDGFNETLLKPSADLEIRAEDIADTYMQDDGLTTEIKAFLDKPIPPAQIWSLMTKFERAKFFAAAEITFTQETLNFRRRARGGQNVDRDINEIHKLLNSQRTDIQKVTTIDKKELYRFYGSELREHICAAEIYNECFGQGDKRKMMYRFNEILDSLEGWHVGARLRTDPEYREQKKPYYRDTPETTDQSPDCHDTLETTDRADDFAGGEPSNPDNLPF